MGRGWGDTVKEIEPTQSGKLFATPMKMSDGLRAAKAEAITCHLEWQSERNT